MSLPARAPKQVGPLTDHSSAIIAGGTAQPLIQNSNAERAYLLIQNLDATHDLWVDFDGNIAKGDEPSIKIPANGALVFENTFIPTGSISIFGGTTGQKFTCKEG